MIVYTHDGSDEIYA